jgi:RNA polymerase-binding transcription factor DksA
VVDEIQFLAGDNLNRSPRESSGDLSSYSFHMADQGTDNFDREFALNLVSSEQDALYEIDDALRRIEMGTYGVCENCNKAIEKARLAALPFAKLCIGCKSESEKGKSRFRPFGPTISQTSESNS